jgi:hypothetical protein
MNRLLTMQFALLTSPQRKASPSSVLLLSADLDEMKEERDKPTVDSVLTRLEVDRTPSATTDFVADG